MNYTALKDKILRECIMPIDIGALVERTKSPEFAVKYAISSLERSKEIVCKAHFVSKRLTNVWIRTDCLSNSRVR